MRRRTTPLARVASLSFAALAFSACAAATTSTGSGAAGVDTERRALVYGHIDAPKRVQTVELAKVGSPRRPRGHVFDNGDFYFEDLAPGDYLLLRFLAGGEWYDLRSWNRESNRRFLVQTTAGGMHYAGSWRVTARATSPGTPAPSGISWKRCGGVGSSRVRRRKRHPGRRGLRRKGSPRLASCTASRTMTRSGTAPSESG